MADNFAYVLADSRVLGNWHGTVFARLLSTVAAIWQEVGLLVTFIVGVLQVQGHREVDGILLEFADA